MPDLTGLPLRPNNLFIDEHGNIKTDRLGSTISSVASESSEVLEFDKQVTKKRNKLEPLTRNLEANRYSSAVRPKQEPSTLEIIPNGSSGKEFLVIRLNQSPPKVSSR